MEQNPDIIGSSRFDDVPWIESIRKFKDEFNDTDDDERRWIFNETFNTFCKDEGEPILKKLKVEANADLELSWNDIVSGNTWGEVKIKVYDPSGIDYIRLSNNHESKNISISPSDLDENGFVKRNIDIDTAVEDWVDGWDLTVRFADNAGNVFTKERHVDGVVESAVDAVTELAGKIVDLFTGLWDTIVDGLSEAADKAVQMANRFVEWVKNEVSSMFSSVVDPIVDGLQNWAEGVAFSFIGLLDELNKWETVDGDESIEATKSQGMKFLLSLVGLQDKAEKIQTVMKKVSNFASPFMKYISPYGVAGLFGEAFGEDIEGLGSYYDDIKNGIAGGLSTVISYTLNLFVGLALTIASSTLDGVKSLLVSTVGSAWTTFFYTTSIDDYLKLAKDWPVGTILTGIGTGEVIACYTGLASYF
ncbi:MAG: hypothetical protein ACLFVB_09950 [Thermoplasmata archaeon]